MDEVDKKYFEVLETIEGKNLKEKLLNKMEMDEEKIALVEEQKNCLIKNIKRNMLRGLKEYSFISSDSDVYEENLKLLKEGGFKVSKKVKKTRNKMIEGSYMHHKIYITEIKW